MSGRGGGGGGAPGAQGGGGGDLQELSEMLRGLQQLEANLQMELEQRQGQRNEIDQAVRAIENLETGSTVQVPLGGDAYVRAEIQDIDEVLVDIGGNYLVENDHERAVELLEQKQDQIDDVIETIREQLAELEEQGSALEQRAQQLRQQQLQQLQQELGGGNEP